MSGLDLVRTARPVLEHLAERTRETVNLGVLSTDGVVYVDQVAGTRAIVTANWVGRRTPLHCTSNGKVLLAYMDDEELERHLAAPLERYTAIARSSTRPGSGAISARSARRGYAQTMEELEDGLNAVAAPVRRADGRVTATVGVSGPAFRMAAVDLPRVGLLTVEAAAVRVSRQLGYVERRPDDDRLVERRRWRPRRSLDSDRPDAARSAGTRRAGGSSSSRRSSGTDRPGR